jgi:putative sterol carrier protein
MLWTTDITDEIGDKINNTDKAFSNMWVNKQWGKAGTKIVSELFTESNIEYQNGGVFTPLDMVSNPYGIEIKYCANQAGRVIIDPHRRKRKYDACKNLKLKPLTIAVVPRKFEDNNEQSSVYIYAKERFKSFEISRMHSIKKFFNVIGGIKLKFDQKDALKILNFINESFNQDMSNAPNLFNKVQNWNKIISIGFSDINTSYFIQIKNGKATGVSKGIVQDPNITIRTTIKTFLDILTGKKNPVIAAGIGQIRVQGNPLDIVTMMQIANAKSNRIGKLMNEFRM